MENKKVVNFLRSLADLLEEDKVEKKDVTSTLSDMLKTAKEKSDGLPKVIRDVMAGNSNTVLGSKTLNTKQELQKTKETFETILKKVEESEKVKTYKSKIAQADQKMEKVLNELNEKRIEAIDSVLEKTEEGKQKLAEILSNTDINGVK